MCVNPHGMTAELNRQGRVSDFCENKWDDIEKNGTEAALNELCDQLGIDDVYEVVKEHFAEKLEERWVDSQREEDYNHGRRSDL